MTWLLRRMRNSVTFAFDRCLARVQRPPGEVAPLDPARSVQKSKKINLYFSLLPNFTETTEVCSRNYFTYWE